MELDVEGLSPRGTHQSCCSAAVASPTVNSVLESMYLC